MKLSKKDYEYLFDKKFSNAYRMKLVKNENCTRLEKIMEMCKGKRVIHFGCCDHMPLIVKKIERKEWLQRLLDDSCEVVVGIDNDKEAVDFVLNNNLSKNVWCVNIENEGEKVEEILKCYRKFDYLVLGEVLEHVDNPVSLLESIKEIFQPYCEKVIITVPNALNANLIRKSRKYEAINSDHKYWFTPYTIAKVMARAEIWPEEIFFVGQVNIIIQALMKIIKCKINNIRSSTLLCVGNLKGEAIEDSK